MRCSCGLKIGDILLMATLAVLSLFLFLTPLGDEGACFEIAVAGEDTVQTCPLDRDASYTVSSGGVTLTVTAKDGEVRVSDADCADRICVHSRAISRAGQSIVCAPAGVVVRIVGEGGDADAISG